MIELLIIRHGETAWNTAEIFRGRVSVGLSETGLHQAELLAGYLAQKKIQAVYCSPLQRALQTAEPVSQRQGLKPQILPELNDLDFGEWEGKPRKEVEIQYKTIYERWLERPDLVQIPGGELLDNARSRCSKALKLIMSDNKEGTAAIITHRVITKILICLLLGLDNSHFWNVEQSTCGVSTFIHNGKFFIMTHHNDTFFLNNSST